MALRGALTHRKTRRLARLLGLPLPCALGVMEALWHVTANHAPTGAIGRLENQDIADEMFWDGDADQLMGHLVTAELVDEDPTHRLVVHGWDEHADQAVKRRVARSGGAMVSQNTPRLAMASHEETPASCDETHARLKPEPEPEPEPVPEPEPEPEPVIAPSELPPDKRAGTRREPDSPFHFLLRAYAEHCHIERLPKYEIEGKAAKELLRREYEPEAVLRCSDFLRMKFQAEGTYLSLVTVNKHIDSWKAAGEPDLPRARAPSTNGSYRQSGMEQAAAALHELERRREADERRAGR